MKSLKEYITESYNEKLLMEVGYYSLFDNIDESVLDKFTSDEKIKDDLTQIKAISAEIKKLSLLLVKKTSMKVAQAAYKQFEKFKTKFKNSHDFRISVLISLFVLVGGTYNYIKTYNDNPIISGSHIERTADTITYTDSKSTVEINTSDIKNLISTDDVKDYEYQTSIRVLQPGETAPTYYKGSPELKKLIAEKMEGCKLYIYSTVAGNPRPKSKDDMKHMKDLTIGYGHKLTAAERRTWNFNKTITEREAWDLFLKDYEKHEQVANEFIKRLPYYDKVEFGQGFIDAMISIRYNSSKELLLETRPEFWNALSKCELGKYELNPEQFNQALDSVKELWANQSAAKGLSKRRHLEYAIMKQPFGEPINKSLYTQNVY